MDGHCIQKAWLRTSIPPWLRTSIPPWSKSEIEQKQDANINQENKVFVIFSRLTYLPENALCIGMLQDYSKTIMCSIKQQ